MRQIVLDTETTGLELADGHRIIEIGCVELLHRRPSGRTWQRFLQPEREVEAGALAVHGITNEFLASQPRFADIAAEFLEFIEGAELVIEVAQTATIAGPVVDPGGVPVPDARISLGPYQRERDDDPRPLRLGWPGWTLLLTGAEDQ